MASGFANSFDEAFKGGLAVGGASATEILKGKIKDAQDKADEKYKATTLMHSNIALASQFGDQDMAKKIMAISEAAGNSVDAQKNIGDIIKGQLDPNKQIANQLAQDKLQNTEDNNLQKSWEKIVKSTDPALAYSRSTLGMAANGNLRADRAMVTLNNPKMTFQDAQNVVADIAGIYAGGAPSDQGMSHSEYQTVQSKLASLQQFLSGDPKDAVTPEIKKHIIGVINDLKSVNNTAISKHLDFQEKANPKVIAKNQDSWNQMKASLLPTDSEPMVTIKSKTTGETKQVTKSEAIKLGAISG